MEVKNLKFKIVLVLFSILLCCFNSVISISDPTMSSDKEKMNSILDPTVGVEFVRDPFPIPRRNIVFIIRSDEGLQTTNVEIIYKIDGKQVYYREENNLIVNPTGIDRCVELPFYGFLQKGKVIVRLWNDNPNNTFDWTFSAKTLGIFFYVCVL
jgi:hypothetical protein